jgi:hypothetical protein
MLKCRIVIKSILESFIHAGANETKVNVVSIHEYITVANVKKNYKV